MRKIWPTIFRASTLHRFVKTWRRSMHCELSHDFCMMMTEVLVYCFFLSFIYVITYLQCWRTDIRYHFSRCYLSRTKVWHDICNAWWNGRYLKVTSSYAVVSVCLLYNRSIIVPFVRTFYSLFYFLFWCLSWSWLIFPVILSTALGLWRNWFHPLLCFSFHNPLSLSLSLSLALPNLYLPIPAWSFSLPSLVEFLHFKEFTVNLSPALSSLFHSSPTPFQGFAIFNTPSLNYIYLLGAAVVRVTVRTVDYPSGEVSGLLQAKSVEQSVFNSKSVWNQGERERERKRTEREREIWRGRLGTEK